MLPCNRVQGACKALPCLPSWDSLRAKPALVTLGTAIVHFCVTAAMSSVHIHQLFLDVGLGRLTDNKVYVKNLALMQAKYGERHTLWGDAEVCTLLRRYPEFHPAIRKFPYKFWLVDFAKYLILLDCSKRKVLGGDQACYVDLDERPLRLLESLQAGDAIVGVDTASKPNNNILCLPSLEVKERLLATCCAEARRVLTASTYRTWKGRALLRGVGPQMMWIFLRQEKLTSSIDTLRYFASSNTRAWEPSVVHRHEPWNVAAFFEALMPASPAMRRSVHRRPASAPSSVVHATLTF